MTVFVLETYQLFTKCVTFNFRFNLIRFSSEVVPWKPSLEATSDDSCQDAVEWVSDFDANGSTCTLNALQVRLLFCECLLQYESLLNKTRKEQGPVVSGITSSRVDWAHADFRQLCCLVMLRMLREEAHVTSSEVIVKPHPFKGNFKGVYYTCVSYWNNINIINSLHTTNRAEGILVNKKSEILSSISNAPRVFCLFYVCQSPSTCLFKTYGNNVLVLSARIWGSRSARDISPHWWKTG